MLKNRSVTKNVERGLRYLINLEGIGLNSEDRFILKGLVISIGYFVFTYWTQTFLDLPDSVMLMLSLAGASFSLWLLLRGVLKA